MRLKFLLAVAATFVACSAPAVFTAIGHTLIDEKNLQAGKDNTTP